MSWYWLIAPVYLLCFLFGYWTGGRRDRRLMRQVEAQPWWPPPGTKPPTSAQLHRRVE
jgi:hypothetical protein